LRVTLFITLFITMFVTLFVLTHSAPLPHSHIPRHAACRHTRRSTLSQIQEIVIFDDKTRSPTDKHSTAYGDANLFLARVLQYLETPQYLRKALFPFHPDLKYAGLLNPLDTPHHLRADERSVYREGVVMSKPVGAGGQGCWVDVGLKREAFLGTPLAPGVRVTVEIDAKDTHAKKRLTGRAVSPSVPWDKLGTYWGYNVRVAPSISGVWTGCPFPGGYDLCLGTSERGTSCVDDADFSLRPFKHLMVVFGGVLGLEEAVACDESLTVKKDDTNLLFDEYVNTCPAQGSRTIRTEEALLISLAALRPHMIKAAALGAAGGVGGGGGGGGGAE
jgi:predicted SPOUT superfamily RNA methylase MTH1